MLRVISLVIGLSFFSTLSESSSPALAWGDTLIKCKIKGVGVRNFKLEDGVWSDKVWERKIIQIGSNGAPKPISKI